MVTHEENAVLMAEYRCPCGAWLTDDDVTRDGEALRCPDCGERVEFFDAMEGADAALEELSGETKTN